MEVKIGVQNAARELTIDSTLDADGVQQAVTDSIAAGGVLTLEDSRGRRLVVPVASLAYVEIAAGAVGTVGFRTGANL